jgi:Uma2 family endonuclease
MSAKSRITVEPYELPPAEDPVRSLLEVILGQIKEEVPQCIRNPRHGERGTDIFRLVVRHE